MVLFAVLCSGVGLVAVWLFRVRIWFCGCLFSGYLIMIWVLVDFGALLGSGFTWVSFVVRLRLLWWLS